MSVKYRIIPRRNPGKPEQEPLFYAHVVNKGEVSVRELANEIANISTVSVVDTRAVIEAFIQAASTSDKGRNYSIGRFWFLCHRHFE